MVSHLQQQESLLQKSILDALYCEEERFDGDFSDGLGFKQPEVEDFNEIHEKPSIFVLEHGLFTEEEELGRLLSKEKSQSCSDFGEINLCRSLKLVRNEAIKWMLDASAHFGFSARTCVLAVNYYDRFIASPCFHEDKPWMSQLVAVSCLSIAAKVEEIRVPLLVDLQVEKSQYLFEAKSVKRMELLVLSTLKWEVNPVTPMCYIDLFVRRFGSMICFQWKFLERFESFILAIIPDCRLLCYLPSEVAAATMLYIISEFGSCRVLDFENQFMSAFETDEGKIEECHKLILEIMKDHSYDLGSNRKHRSFPSSPNGVIDAYFSSDCSNDLWDASSPISSSPEPVIKRSKIQE